MTEDEPKPRAVIDVKPDPDDDQGGADVAAAPTRQDRPRRSRGWLPVLVLVLVLVPSVAAGIFWGYHHVAETRQALAGLEGRLATATTDRAALRQAVEAAVATLAGQQDQMAEQQRVLAEQRKALEASRVALDGQRQLFADEGLRMQEREAQLRSAVADVYRRVGRSGNQWIIAETEYLMRVAGHRLVLAGDVATARVALELADQRLRDTNDPAWTGVREQLAREIAQLAAFDAPDIDGLAARLAALAERVPGLVPAGGRAGPPLSSGVAEVARPVDGTNGDAVERGWSTLVDDLWAGFRDTVRIREHDRPIQAMLPPEHGFFLRENLRLQLESARAALVRGDAAMYQASLARAARWLDDHFTAAAGDAVAMRDAIVELRTIDIAPPLPDVGRSLRVLLARQESMGDVQASVEAADSP